MARKPSRRMIRKGGQYLGEGRVISSDVPARTKVIDMTSPEQVKKTDEFKAEVDRMQEDFGHASRG